MASKHKFKEKPTAKIRREIKLEEWRFILDKDKKGIREGYFSGNHDEKSWESVTCAYECY